MILSKKIRTKILLFYYIGPMLVLGSYGLVDYKYQFLFNHFMLWLVLALGPIMHIIEYYGRKYRQSIEQDSAKDKFSEIHFWFPVIGLASLHFLLYMTNQSMEEADQKLQSSTPSIEVDTRVQLDLDAKLSEMEKSADEGIDQISQTSLGVNDTNVYHFMPSPNDIDLRIQFTERLNKMLRQDVSVVFDEADGELQRLTQDYGEKLANLIITKNWDEVEALMNQYNNDIPELGTITANLLLMFGADLDVVFDYLAKGAQVSGAATLNLIKSGRVEDLERLENFGVSFNSDLPLDLSILDLALMSELSPTGFEFLIERIGETGQFKQELGVDTLAVAIMTAENNPAFSSHYINSIINTAGVDVTQYHVDLLTALSNHNPDLAEEIGLMNNSLVK
jgi:hypothetical protein